MSQVVVEDDAFIQELVEAMESQTMPVWDFQGVLKGRNGTEELQIYSSGRTHCKWRKMGQAEIWRRMVFVTVRIFCTLLMLDK